MAAPTPKAFSYIRFSSPEQAKGDSYRRQRAMAEKYCAEHDLELASSREYTFLDKGRSAYKARHLDDEGQLRRFLDLVESGAIERGSYLLVESLDRLSREKVSTALPRFMDLLNSGIRVVTLSDSRLYTEDFNELDLIISIVHMSRAHNESSMKADRLSAAWNEKKRRARSEKKPLGRACPAWLELVDNTYQPIPERVAVVQRIFDLAIKGYGQAIIPRMLNEAGVPVFGSRNRNHAQAWGNSSVSKLLGNRALLGEYQPTHIVDGVRINDGEPVTGFFPAVVPEEMFYQAQAARAERRVYKAGNQSARFNVLQGIIKCSRCGDAMHLVNKGRPPKGFTYIQCHSKRKGVCDNGYARVERVEQVIREVLAKVDSLSLVQANQSEISRALATANGKLQDTTQRYETTIELLNQNPSAALAAIVARLEKEQSALKTECEVLRESLAVNQVESKEDFFERLDLVSFEGRHAANSLLKRLRVTLEVLTQGPKDQWYSVNIEGAAKFLIFHNEDTVTIRAVDADSLDKLVMHGDIDADTYKRLADVGDLVKGVATQLSDQIIAQLRLQQSK